MTTENLTPTDNGTVTQNATLPVEVGPPAPSRRARAPRATGPATRLAVLLALMMITLGAVALHDSATAAGWVPGSAWLVTVVDAADGLVPQSWFLPVAVVVVIFGLYCMVSALTPRRDSGVPVEAHSAVYVGLDDVARLASAAAASVPGVTGARSTARRHRVTVRCRVGRDTTDVATEVRRAVDAELAVLSRTPKVTVRVQKEQNS